MDDWQTKLADVLGRYDEQTEPFMEVDVQCSLEAILPAVQAAGPVPVEIEAEVLAFAFSEDLSRQNGGWDTYFGPMFSGTTKDGSIHNYPSLNQITPAILEYWTNRAGQAKHPVLRFRYAGLVWDLAQKVKGIPRRVELARAMVDAAVTIAEPMLTKHESDEVRTLERAHHEADVFRKLARAHEVALALNDATRVETVRNALMQYEQQTAQNHLIGTWGRCFDFLVVSENKKFPLTTDQRERLIADLETRLGQHAGETNPEQLEPRAVEAAALRLASHYRRRQQQDDMRRVLAVYADAYLRKAEVVSGMVVASTLHQVCDTLFDFGLRAEAEVVAGHYRHHAERTTVEMKAITHTTSISPEEITAFLQPWTQGDLPDLLAQFANHYIPRREAAEKQVREHAQAFPFSHLVTTAILDHDGRITAQVGPVEHDMEGHIVRNISQTMGFVSVFLRLVVERLVTARGLNAERVAEFLAQSPVFDPTQRSILGTGLHAYFAQDWLVSIHLFVPQIENTVRRLVRLTGGSGLKQGRNGAMLLKTLDDLLREDRVEQTLGADVASYFRILLSDQRGWNVRNNVCHGLTPVDQFHSAVADRLLHVLLCLGTVEARPQPTHDSAEADANDLDSATDQSEKFNDPGIDGTSFPSAPSEPIE